MPTRSFWNGLSRPVFSLAPMEDVTDRVFRDIVSEAGKPDVFYSEFVSARAILKGDREALRRLEFTAGHRPMIAQIWGNEPQTYHDAVIELHRRGFDGVDINMGCPHRKITSKGSCSGLINTPALAAELIAAAKEGAWAAWKTVGVSHRGPKGKLHPEGPIPVSVKTRIGFHQPVTDQWAGFLLEQNIAVLTVHGRTSAQQSEGEANWEEVSRVAKLRNRISPDTLVFGNGDVQSIAQAREYSLKHRLDGVMIGRGIFSNPFLFSREDFHRQSPEEKIGWALKHLNQYQKAYEGRRNFEIMKKFFKIYLSEFEGAEALREVIMETHDYPDAREVLRNYNSV